MSFFSKKSIKFLFFNKKLRFYSKITEKSKNLLYFTKKVTFSIKLRESLQLFYIFLTFLQNNEKEECIVEKITKIYSFKDFLQVNSTYFFIFL